MASFYELTTDLLNIGSQDRGTDAETMGKRAINRAYRRLLDAVDNRTEKRSFTFTSVASQQDYGLPLYVADIVSIVDPTNKKELEPMSEEELDYYWPGSTSSGTPHAYYPIGRYGTQVHPDGNTVTFVSDNASDDAQIRVTGFVSGILQSELITINGTTNVTSSKSYTTIESMTKLASTSLSIDGNITVTEDGSNGTIAVIPYWVTSPSYQWIGLHKIPDAAITYTVRADMYKPNLVHDYDWPSIEEDYHDLILLDALTEVLPVWGKPEEAIYYERKFSRRMKEMRRQQGRKASQDNMQFDDVTTGNRMHPHRPLIQGIDFV